MLLDLRRQVVDADMLERAVSAAASIVRTHLRRGDHARLVTTTGVDSGYGVGASHLDGILEYLAVAARSNSGSLHVALEIVERGVSGATVLVTGGPTEGDIELFEQSGPAVKMRRVVRFDRAERRTSARRTEVLGIPPGSSFQDTWTDATTSSARGRGRGGSRRQGVRT